MKMKSTLWLLALSAVFILQSCSDDDGEPRVTGQYAEGMLIANEGQFGSANATLSHYDPEGGTLTANIFRDAIGNFAGDVLQSVTIDGSKAYVVLNGSNKIEVAHSGTFVREQTFTSDLLDKPQYVTIINGKAYVSVWGPYIEGGYSLIDSYVLVANASTFELIDTIRTDEGTSEMLYNGKYLFASNTNFGASSTLAVIDPAKNELVDQLELAAGPAGLVLDANKKLWVVTTGSYAQDSKLFRINPNTLDIEETIELGVDAKSDLAITADGKTLFYASGSSVYRISIDATEAPESPFIESDAMELYALGVDPETGEIYVGDAVNYFSEGQVYVYNTDGSFKTQIAAGGISPTQFIFRK